MALPPVPLGYAIKEGRCRCAFISSPACGPRPGAKPGEGPFDFKVMPILERLVYFFNDTQHKMVAGYDFAGSSSQKECNIHVPDKNTDTWETKDGIRSTQWARYWSGLVRGTMREMLFMSDTFQGDAVSGAGSSSAEREGESFFPPMSRAIFVFSITGGPITQMEYSLIPSLISGVLADFSRMEIKDYDNNHIIWIHFETVFDLHRALAGYGTIDLDSYFRGGRALGQPCKWTDGSTWNVDSCIYSVCDFGGHEPTSPEQLWDWLQLENLPVPVTEVVVPMDTKLVKAVKSGDSFVVQQLLGEKADANARDASDEAYGYCAIHWAVGMVGNLETIKLLLDAKADPSAKTKLGFTPSGLVNKEDLYQLEAAKEAGLSAKVLALLKAAGAADAEAKPAPASDASSKMPAMPLGLAIAEGKCRCAFISSPGTGPRPGSSGAPFDFQVMPILERLVYMFADTSHKMIAGYDFAGSSSAKECSVHAPDNIAETWETKESIRTSQWARYWSGLVRGTMRSLLLMAEPFSGDDTAGKAGAQRDGESFFPPMSRAIFVFSISGGTITQTEYGLIPGLVNGVLADFARMDIRDFDHLNIIWVHFNHVFELYRALVGYGTIDLDSYFRGGRALGQPCKWTDNQTWNEEACMFQVCDFEGYEPTSPEQLWDWLQLKNLPVPETALTIPMDMKLCKAVKSCDAFVVKALLDDKANPNALDTSDVAYGYYAIHWAVGTVGNVEMIESLLDAKADVNLLTKPGGLGAMFGFGPRKRNPLALLNAARLYNLPVAKEAKLYDKVLRLLLVAGVWFAFSLLASTIFSVPKTVLKLLLVAGATEQGPDPSALEMLCANLCGKKHSQVAIDKE